MPHLLFSFSFVLFSFFQFLGAAERGSTGRLRPLLNLRMCSACYISAGKWPPQTETICLPQVPVQRRHCLGFKMTFCVQLINTTKRYLFYKIIPLHLILLTTKFLSNICMIIIMVLSELPFSGCTQSVTIAGNV